MTHGLIEDPRILPRRLTGRAVFATLLSLGCAGCWQEIRYEPSSVETQSPAASPAITPRGTPAETLPVALPETPPDTRPEIVEANVPAVTQVDVAKPDVITPIMPAQALPEKESPVAAEPEETRKVLEERPKLDTEFPTFDLEAETVEQPAEPAEVSPALRQPNRPAPPRSALATWRMASKWSFAAARLAKGQGPDRYGENLEQARYAATLLNIELPDLPEDLPAADREKVLIAFLNDDGGPQLSGELLEHYDVQHAALADLAIRTHVLLLTYTPKSPRLTKFLPLVRQAAKDSMLPQGVWQGLVTLLEERADFKKVKTAIYQLHRQASAELGKASSP